MNLMTRNKIKVYYLLKLKAIKEIEDYIKRKTSVMWPS